MTLTATKARADLFPLIEQVNNDRAPVHITSRKGNAVLMSEADWEAWQETVYLFSNPANARWLLESMAQAEGGRAEVHDLIEP
jgi:antitoxin YefM